MAETIKCPICGEINDARLDLCTNCRSELRPKATTNIPSGQNPTKKNTAELEPILPQWLRDARNAAKTSEPEDSVDFLAQQEKPKSPASAPNLLAGLQSQANDNNEDEEVPDWLANITGASPKPRLAKDEPATDVRWVEMGGKDDFAKSDEEDEVPAWLTGVQNIAQPEKDELTDWLRDTTEADPVVEEKESAFEMPQASTSDDMPDWLKNLESESNAKNVVEDLPSQTEAQFDTDTPDWLKGLETKSAPVEAQLPVDAPEINFDMPDWLGTLGASEEKSSGLDSVSFAESDVPSNEALTIPAMDMPDWLQNPSEVKEEKPSQDTTTPLWLKQKTENAEPEMPAWLASEETVRLNDSSVNDASQSEALNNLPDWLNDEKPEVNIFGTTEIDELKPAIEKPVSDDLFKTIQLPSESQDQNSFDDIDMPSFTPDTQTGNLEGLFADMPDWLSDVAPASSPQTVNAKDDELLASNLPSWVEAMRPSDSGLSRALSSSVSDQTLESRGALAGLQGVLPAQAGFTPTSKPKAYSLKLNANDEQMRHAAILEEILAAETAPVALESFSTLRTSRSLRWALAILMLAVVIGTRFLNTQIFSMPQGVPNEVNAVLQITQTFPENARLLVAFDYEPSRVGEMEAAAAPLFDNLILLKHPYLTFISTNETGSALAERFISGPLAGHQYQAGVNYSNLGYLPGGQLGIHPFAQTPTLIAPLDVTGQAVWALAPLQDITALNQFTGMILVTDNADAARVWIEQTEGLRGDMPFIVISSAQSAPMIQPYYQSGQIMGMVSGLYGGAIFEQYNAGRPGTARNYWDAYSIGMLIAMVLVLGGGFWNLVLGLRERAARREGK